MGQTRRVFLRLHYFTTMMQKLTEKLKEQKLFVVALALIVLDQITKVWVKGFSIGGWIHEGMPLHSSVPVIGDIVRWTYVENPGMAFGITFGDGKIFLSLFSVVAAMALSWYLYAIRKGPMVIQLGVMLLLAGATGNLIDRVFYGVIYNEAALFYGKVVDFIDVDCPDFTVFDREITRWYVFNIADACVSCGIALLLIFNYKVPSHGQTHQQISQSDILNSEKEENGSATDVVVEKNEQIDSEKDA